jgi:two-component system, cell cycle response regulator DivK
VKQRILVVEDNLVNRELLRDWLEGEGYEAWLAEDLETSYKVCAKHPPDAILLDIHLGEENGLDLVAWMRQNPEMQATPVIAVTAHALPVEREGILRAGCQACLPKPIDFVVLQKELHRWLQDRTDAELAC